MRGNAFVIGGLVGSGLWLCGTNVPSAIGLSLVTFFVLGGWKLIRTLQVIPRDIR